MLKQIVSWMFILLLLTGVLTVTLRIQQAKPQPLEPPPTEWIKTYGGASFARAVYVIETSDGGYALTGYNSSGGDWHAEYTDAWFVKTDADGNMEWNQTYGGTGDEATLSVVEISDGGYALTGYTESFSAGDTDYWLIKTDANGDAQWNKTYGGTKEDCARSIVQAEEEGYVLAGHTGSFGAGHDDAWLVKTDANGNMEWNRTYGGTGWDYARSVVQTDDGGYALAGYTDSFGAGGADFWLVKTDANGNMEWNQTHGGTGWDYAFSLVQTRDGGYALAGYTGSFGAGHDDAWLVKTDANGNMEWNRTYGGTDPDYARSVVQTRDGGYALTGPIMSFDTGNWDAWLVKTDADGNMEWNQTYRGGREDRTWSLKQTRDGGYVLAGDTESFGANNRDFWLIKTKGGIYVFDVAWGKGIGPYFITVLCDYYVTSFSFDKTELSFVLSPLSTTDGSGLCNLTIPRCRLDSPFSLMINETLVTPYVLTQNETDSTLSFTYTPGTHQVKITGTELGHIIGDINSDGEVNILDITIVAINFGNKEGYDT